MTARKIQTYQPILFNTTDINNIIFYLMQLESSSTVKNLILKNLYLLAVIYLSFEKTKIRNICSCLSLCLNLLMFKISKNLHTEHDTLICEILGTVFNCNSLIIPGKDYNTNEYLKLSIDNNAKSILLAFLLPDVVKLFF